MVSVNLFKSIESTIGWHSTQPTVNSRPQENSLVQEALLLQPFFMVIVTGKVVIKPSDLFFGFHIV